MWCGHREQGVKKVQKRSTWFLWTIVQITQIFQKQNIRKLEKKIAKTHFYKNNAKPPILPIP